MERLSRRCAPVLVSAQQSGADEDDVEKVVHAFRISSLFCLIRGCLTRWTRMTKLNNTDRRLPSLNRFEEFMCMYCIYATPTNRIGVERT